MDIGTGKDLNEYIIDDYNVPYHLIDIIDAGKKYNVYQFQKDFLKTYKYLQEKKTTPILCGGSGMYIESILKGYKLTHVPENTNLRNDLKELSLSELEKKLKEISPLHNTSDTKDKERAIRAIEIALYNKTQHSHFPKIPSLTFGIKYERNILKERITHRLKDRLRNGLIDEVESLLQNGIPSETLEYYGLEYRYITYFLNKKISYNKMFELLNIAIHQFSKKQMTWFRRMEKNEIKINWIDGNLSIDTKIKNILKIIDNNTII
jgi:tRNA dimethylallyltransferase